MCVSYEVPPLGLILGTKCVFAREYVRHRYLHTGVYTQWCTVVCCLGTKLHTVTTDIVSQTEVLKCATIPIHCRKSKMLLLESLTKVTKSSPSCTTLVSSPDMHGLWVTAKEQLPPSGQLQVKHARLLNCIVSFSHLWSSVVLMWCEWRWGSSLSVLRQERVFPVCQSFRKHGLAQTFSP